MKPIKPPRPREKGEGPSKLEIVRQDKVSAPSNPPHGVEGSAAAAECKPIKYGHMAEAASKNLLDAAWVFKNHGITLPYFSDMSRQELARYAEAVDYLMGVAKRIVPDEPAPGSTAMEIVAEEQAAGVL